VSSTVAMEAASERMIRIIFEHAARISGEQDLETLIRLHADFARDLVGADRCSVWLVDAKSGDLWTKVAHGLEAIRIPAGQGLVGACIVQNETLLVNDVTSETRHFRKVDQNSGYRTEQVLCVPLRAEGRVIGALQCLNKAGGFTQADLHLAGFLAQFSASALESEQLRQQREQAQRLQHELDLARQVQARLLPRPDLNPPDLEFIGACRPAKGVGGDYYDAIALPDGNFAFTLGDVAGKGIPAALAMAGIQTLLRSLLQHNAENLSDSISELSRSVYASSATESYSTLFCGVLSGDRSTLTYVNAGHIPPLVVRAGEDVKHLPGGDIPVGMLPAWKYTEHKFLFQPGDLLVVVSDGIVEACDPTGTFWDEKQVENLLAGGLHRLNVSEIPDALCREVDNWARGADQYDDMTVVALRIPSALPGADRA
jgi:phosphoserine phosphatase RsbU/P